MRVNLYSNSQKEKLKVLLDEWAVPYFLSNFKYGGFMYEDFEGNFLLPYKDKAVESTSFFGLIKKYEYQVENLEHHIKDYIKSNECCFYGNSQLETVRRVFQAIDVIDGIGGELQISEEEIEVIARIEKFKNTMS